LPIAIAERLYILRNSSLMIEMLSQRGCERMMFRPLINRALGMSDYQRAADLQRLSGEKPR
jgi:hypothetical protein